MFRRALTIMGCILLCAIFSVRADEWSKKTVVTFSAPVELPGIVLPAGTYVFKLADFTGERHVVQVFNKDETRLYTTILAIPNLQLTPKGETIMRFDERPKGTPEALRAWFYPGDNTGQEFVYPKARAVTLAAETKTAVLAMPMAPEMKAEELKAAPVETVAPPVVAEEAPAEHWNATPPTVEETEATPAPAPAPAPAMPKTASPLYLVALGGMFSLSLGWLLKRRS